MLLVTVFSAKSATDVITASDVKKIQTGTGSNIQAIVTASNLETVNSGAEYKLTKLSSNGTTNYWRYYQNTATAPGLLTVTKSGGTIKSVTLESRTNSSNYLSGTIICASHEEITGSNYTSAPFKEDFNLVRTSDSNVFDSKIITLPESYEYVALISTKNNMYLQYHSMTFEWEEPAADVPAAKPEITAPEPVKVGSEFTFATTAGTEYNYQYALADVEFTAAPETWTGNGTGASFTVPNDAAGKYLYLSVTAGGEGFTESEAAIWTGLVAANPKAAAPTIKAPAEVKAGQSFTFSTETQGAQISYQVVREDAKLTGTATPNYDNVATRNGRTYEITDADAGKWLYFRVWAGGTGFENSDYTENHFEIAANPTAETPTIAAPADADVRGGAVVTFTSQAGTSVKYYVAYSENEINEADAEYSYAWEQPFVLPYDKAGQYIYIKAVANGTGFNESAPAYWHALVLANPAAAAPEIEAPTELKIGQTFTFTTTQEGVTISYKYAVSETETAEPAYGEAVEGTEFTIPADANGKWLYISATANGEKYTESPAATWGKQIMKTAEPVFFGYDVFDSTTVSAKGQDVEIIGSTTGLNYTGYFANLGDKYGVGAYDKQAALANTDSKDGLYVEYVEYSSDLYQTFASNKANVYVANEPITLANYESVATFVKTLTANPADLRADIEGNYCYVAIISGGAGTNPLGASYINIGWKQVPAESNVAATPEFKNDLPSPLRAGTVIELTSATEGAKISYKVVYTNSADEVVDFDAITATEAQTAPVSITIPDDAAQKHMRLWAQATADGYEASKPFIYTVYVDFPTGVDTIDAEEGEAEYYTLQGVRVANPEKGIYVRVANGKAAKVVL